MSLKKFGEFFQVKFASTHAFCLTAARTHKRRQKRTIANGYVFLPQHWVLA